MTAHDDFTFGIEEEFFLVDPITRTTLPAVPERFVESCRARLGQHAQHEMLQSQIELVSPVFDDCAAASAEMHRLRSELIAVTEGAGMRLVSVGSLPLARWTQQVHTDNERYAQLIDDFQLVGRRNMVCGMHVHVGVPDGVDRVQLMNRLLPWTPLFLALSTSSPFWQGQDSGLLSYRQAGYDEWPRTGIPDHFEDEAQYDAFVELMTKTKAIADSSSLWWVIRPARLYPTLELRIADACTELDDTLALAALYRCLVRAHVRRPELGTLHTAMTRRIIDENRWRAKRFGTGASFIDERRGDAIPAVTMLGEALDLVAVDARELGCEALLRRFTALFRNGTSAHRQRRLYRQRRLAGDGRIAALQHVTDWLIDATRPELQTTERMHTTMAAA